MSIATSLLPLPSVTPLQIDSVTFAPAITSPASHNPLFLGGAGSVVSDDTQKVILKGMGFNRMGFEPGQALMLWKRLYKDNIWAKDVDELEGLNKDLKRMISEHAEFGALSFKDIRSAELMGYFHDDD